MLRGSLLIFASSPLSVCIALSVIDSMRALGFDSYMEFLQQYLKKYRQSTKVAKSVSDKPLAPGAHKRGRKARGADDDDDDAPHHGQYPQATSPINLPSEYSTQSNSSGPALMTAVFNANQNAAAAAAAAAAGQQQQQAAQEEHNAKRRKA